MNKESKHSCSSLFIEKRGGWGGPQHHNNNGENKLDADHCQFLQSKLKANLDSLHKILQESRDKESLRHEEGSFEVTVFSQDSHSGRITILPWPVKGPLHIRDPIAFSPGITMLYVYIWIAGVFLLALKVGKHLQGTYC